MRPQARGGYSCEFLVGVCRPVLQILTRFQTKKLNFPHPFSDLAFTQKLCYRYVERKPKHFSNAFRICTSFFLFYLFGVETINTFIHSHSSIENHTRFQTKMGKVYTLFQAKTAQKPYPMWRHIPI